MNALLAIDIMLDKKSGTPISWGRLPEDFWSTLSFVFLGFGVNRIGFGGCDTLESLRDRGIIQELELEPIGNCRYMPFHGKNQSKSIIISDFNESVALNLSKTRIHDWSLEFDCLKSDEIVFFIDRSLFSIVVPYEDAVIFYGLDDNAILRLSEMGDLFAKNVHLLNASGGLK